MPLLTVVSSGPVPCCSLGLNGNGVLLKNSGMGVEGGGGDRIDTRARIETGRPSI